MTTKMRKVDLRNYNVTVVDEKTGQKKEVPYKVREVLVGLIFHRDLMNSAIEARKLDKIADKIEDEGKDYVLLSEEEYEKVKKPFEKVGGFGRFEVELINRVLDAEEVEVDEVQ